MMFSGSLIFTLSQTGYRLNTIINKTLMTMSGKARECESERETTGGILHLTVD